MIDRTAGGCRDGRGLAAPGPLRFHNRDGIAPSRRHGAPDLYPVPPILPAWLSVFRPCFTAPVWNRVLILVAGTVLAPGRRTVTRGLRVMGLAEDRHFRGYHEILSRARRGARAVWLSHRRWRRSSA